MPNQGQLVWKDNIEEDKNEKVKLNKCDKQLHGYCKLMGRFLKGASKFEMHRGDNEASNKINDTEGYRDLELFKTFTALTWLKHIWMIGTGIFYTWRLRLCNNISIDLGHDKEFRSLYNEYNPWDKLKWDLDN